MVAKRSSFPNVIASVALFVVILGVSIALAITTDINSFARGAIAVASGLVAAAVTFVIANRAAAKKR